VHVNERQRYPRYRRTCRTCNNFGVFGRVLKKGRIYFITNGRAIIGFVDKKTFERRCHRQNVVDKTRIEIFGVCPRRKGQPSRLFVVFGRFVLPESKRRRGNVLVDFALRLGISWANRQVSKMNK